MKVNKEIDKAVGVEILIARRKKGITQKELGNLLGVVAQQVGFYERGRGISLSRLEEIADLLGTTVKSLIPDEY